MGQRCYRNTPNSQTVRGETLQNRHRQEFSKHFNCSRNKANKWQSRPQEIKKLGIVK